MAARMPTRLRASGRFSSPAMWSGSGSASVLARRIFMRDGVGIVGQVDARLVGRIRLRHLLRAVAQRHHPRGDALDQRLDGREELHAVVVVELLRDVVGQFQVLLLVVADRHLGRVIGQDVGRHQVRIDVQPGRRRLLVLAGLVLELRHAVQPAQPRDAVEDPGEFGMRRAHATARTGCSAADRARRRSAPPPSRASGA